MSDDPFEKLKDAMNKRLAKESEFKVKEPKNPNDGPKTLSEKMSVWTGKDEKKPLDETTASEYSKKAFGDNAARATSQSMYNSNKWKIEPDGMLRTTMKSNSGGGDYKLSLFPFKLPDVLRRIANGETDYSKLATEVVRGDIAPFCSCPNFLYQNAGPKGANRQLLNPSGSKTDKANWGLCKHLLFPVETFPFLQSEIAKKLKEGYFKLEDVDRHFNDGKTKAFLHEHENGSAFIVLPPDALINEALDFEQRIKNLKKALAEANGEKLYESMLAESCKANPDFCDYDVLMETALKVVGGESELNESDNRAKIKELATFMTGKGYVYALKAFAQENPQYKDKIETAVKAYNELHNVITLI